MRVDRGLDAELRDGGVDAQGPLVGESPSQESLSSLRRFAGTASQAEHCELCGAPVEHAHPHLLDRNTRTIMCACGGCALLFSNQQSGRFLRIPVEVRAVRDLALDGFEWETLAIPIDLAFIVRGADGRLRAMYPSPAGAIESSLTLEAIEQALASSSAATMQPEVEALLVSRMAGEEAAFVAPIDECYRLTGLIRSKWRGLSGGTEVRIAMRDFFTELRTRAGVATGVHHA